LKSEIQTKQDERTDAEVADYIRRGIENKQMKELTDQKTCTLLSNIIRAHRKGER
jgi:hypothetical protein